MHQTIRRVAMLAVLGIAGVGASQAAAAPAPAVTHQGARAATPAFVFGREGGNIRPFVVTIDAGGVVTVTGGIRVLVPHAQLTPDALDGLRKLASAEGFPAMPARIDGLRVNPDVGALYIAMSGKAGVKKVRVHGVRNPAFAQLFDVLLAAAGLAY
ncbi:MAG: hypothetical protein NVSMB65_16060 [Chloroflexota bacterium]